LGGKTMSNEPSIFNVVVLYIILFVVILLLGNSVKVIYHVYINRRRDIMPFDKLKKFLFSPKKQHPSIASVEAYIATIPIPRLLEYEEKFMSLGEGGKIYANSLRSILNGKPISDVDFLALVWKMITMNLAKSAKPTKTRKIKKPNKLGLPNGTS
jgi:hypothetical protein